MTTEATPTLIQLNNNLLHYQPLGARIWNGTQYLAGACHRMGPEKGWQGKALRALTVSASLSVYILTAPLALIELLASSTLFTLGCAIHIATNKKYALIEKHTVKALAYSINSVAVLLLTIVAFVPRLAPVLIPRYRTIATGTSQGTHIASAMLAHLLAGSLFHNSQVAVTRMAQSALEALPAALERIVSSFLADFRPQMMQHIESQDFFQNLSENDQEFIRNFNMRRISEPEYRSRFADIASQYLNQSGVPTQHVEGEVSFDVYGNELNTYRKHLFGWVKGAVERIKQQYILPEGNDTLEMFAPEATFPIAHIAQLLELEEEETCCPASFSHEDLSQYSHRKEKIEEAKSMLCSLTEEQKNNLIQRLIQGENRSDETDELYKKIAELAGDLHQGKLMTVNSFDTRTGEFSANNYFVKAWQEAVNS